MHYNCSNQDENFNTMTKLNFQNVEVNQIQSWSINVEYQRMIDHTIKFLSSMDYLLVGPQRLYDITKPEFCDCCMSLSIECHRWYKLCPRLPFSMKTNLLVTILFIFFMPIVIFLAPYITLIFQASQVIPRNLT